jgi:SAM-dependent methyltransferase
VGRARGTSFGTAAEAYERARPTYPAVAVRDLLGTLPLDVLDLGAGTGKLTRTLVAEGHRVRAVDPDADMLAQLARAVPGIPHDVGSAESLPLEDASLDAVVAAQAYHWFDPATALPEIARVLRPGGLLGLLWNVRDERSPWVARFGELVGREDAGDNIIAPVLTPLFSAAAVRWYEHRQLLTEEGLVDLAASRSNVIGLDEAARTARLEEVAALGREVAEDGCVRMPYRLQVWSGAKIG